jgi:hypothetical protein
MVDEETGTGSGEEQTESPEEAPEETPSEGVEDGETSEAAEDVKSDRPAKNYVEEARRKERKAKRELAQLRTEFEAFKASQGTASTPTSEVPGGNYTKEQLAGVYATDPKTYGFNAIDRLVDMKLEDAKASMFQENKRETVIADAERQATEMYPDLLDEDSEFREKVAVEFNRRKAQLDSIQPNSPLPPYMVLDVANHVARLEGIQPSTETPGSWDELTRARNAKRGEAPPAQPKPAVKKAEDGLDTLDANMKLAEKQGRDLDKAREFFKNDPVSLRAAKMRKEGY